MSNTLWDSAYKADKEPAFEEFGKFINNRLWEGLNLYINNSYGVKPEISYSVCSMQRGWNIKYKKSGRALCTLYPENGYFTALVVIGDKEDFAVNAMLPAFTEYMQNLYKNTRCLNKMGRWLMVDVKDENVLKDVKALISIKAGK